MFSTIVIGIFTMLAMRAKKNSTGLKGRKGFDKIIDSDDRGTGSATDLLGQQSKQVNGEKS